MSADCLPTWPAMRSTKSGRAQGIFFFFFFFKRGGVAVEHASSKIKKKKKKKNFFFFLKKKKKSKLKIGFCPDGSAASPPNGNSQLGITREPF